MKQAQAIRALRLNYRWRGVYRWLRRRRTATGLPGWRLVLHFPEHVIQEQEAIAEGAFS